MEPNLPSDFIVSADTAPSSPYMRSSPQALASDASIHELPPESSSPLLTSPSFSSPYFPVAALSASDDTSSSSTSNSNGGNISLTESLVNESISPSCLRYSICLPIQHGRSDSSENADHFAQSLYERLLVVAQERESIEDIGLYVEVYDTRSTCFDGVSTAYLPHNDLFDSSCDDSDLETPFFASPPLSENITPPRLQKRTREMEVGDEHPGRSLTTSGASEDDKRSRNEENLPYRIIWRAESYQIYQNRLGQLRKEDWEKETPPMKRQKANSNRRRKEYALNPASLRRAASLRSDCSSVSDSSESGQELTPTQPSTPVVSNHGSRDSSFSKYGVPIIAPPPDHISALPMSTETMAKIRIRGILEKESALRGEDGLDSPCLNLQRADVDLHKGSWEELLTIGQLLREDVIDWLLNVLPQAPCSSNSTPGGSFSSTSSHNSRSNFPVDLYDELSSYPETRFHAVYIFLRFFYRVMCSEFKSAQAPSSDDTTYVVNELNEEEGRELVIWDIAVASLALSVKLHRDVLEPLSPVYAWEYLELARHRITFDNLEAAQRDVLSALSYNLGTTPQSLLDNLWLALPSLRQLFDYEGGWNYVLKETWLQLFDLVSEPDVLQFSLSLLTVACLIEGILAAMAQKKDYMLTWRKSVAKNKGITRTGIKSNRKKKLLRKAGEKAEGVIQDIQAATCVRDAELQECRAWLVLSHACEYN